MSPPALGRSGRRAGGGPVDVGEETVLSGRPDGGEETVARGRPDSERVSAPQSRRENRDSLFSEVPTYSSQRS